MWYNTLVKQKWLDRCGNIEVGTFATAACGGWREQKGVAAVKIWWAKANNKFWVPQQDITWLTRKRLTIVTFIYPQTLETLHFFGILSADFSEVGRQFSIKIPNNQICTVCIMERYIAYGDDSLTLRLVSKLPDLRVANAKWIQWASSLSLVEWGSIIMMHAVAQLKNVYSLHHGEIFRLRRRYPHPAPDKRACRSSGGICEVDSRACALEPHLIKLHNYDARCCIIIMERYRSGHNGADSKSVCAKSTRGFESLSLRHKNKEELLLLFVFIP